MPKLNAFEVRVKTGQHGMEQTPRYSINGFALDFDQESGDVRPGGHFEGRGMPDSFPHSLHLIGPEEGVWDIDELSITYHPAGEPPYVLRFAPITLDAESNLSIWHPRQAVMFDV